MKRKGLVQIYTGEGKGKTTAAVGLAARALGHGLKVCYISFHKDPRKWLCGEIKALKKLGADIYSLARSHPCFDREVSRAALRKECLDGIGFIKKLAGKKGYDLLILDEINICLRDGFLREKELLGLIADKPAKLEIVLTGRGAGGKIIKAADLVTETKKVKHPHDSGIPARRGIEY